MIPKSLHTVSALVRVARLLRDRYPADMAPETLIDLAARVLGYGVDVPDPHGLKAAAARKLAKEQG